MTISMMIRASNNLQAGHFVENLILMFIQTLNQVPPSSIKNKLDGLKVIQIGRYIQISLLDELELVHLVLFILYVYFHPQMLAVEQQVIYSFISTFPIYFCWLPHLFCFPFLC